MDHAVFDTWKSITDAQISPDGNWVAYVLQPGKGDPRVLLYDVAKKASLEFHRSDQVKISPDNDYACWILHPPLDSLESMRRKGTPKSELPPDTLAIFDLKSRTLDKVPSVSTFVLGKTWGEYVSFQVEGPGEKKEKDLVVYEMATGKTDTFPGVSRFILSEERPRLLIQGQGEDSAQSPALYMYYPERQLRLRLLTHAQAQFHQLSLDPRGGQAAFLATIDTLDAGPSSPALYFWKGGMTHAMVLADNSLDLLPDSWQISPHEALRFSQDGKQLYFGVAPIPTPIDSTRLPEERVQVEIWHYQDAYLYTEQEAKEKALKEKAFLAVCHVLPETFHLLGRDTLPDISLGNEGNAPYVLGTHDLPYRRAASWEGFSRKDLYLISTEAGPSRRIAQGVSGNPSFSPEARFVYWYELMDSTWYLYEVATQTLRTVNTQGLPPLYNEENDLPQAAYPYGSPGWAQGDRYLYLYDRYDIWQVDPLGDAAPVRLTQGRENETRYRYLSLDPEARALDEAAPWLLHFRHLPSKAEGYARLLPEKRSLEVLLTGPFRFGRPLKARDAQALIFTKENYQVFPDLVYANSGSFKQTRKISQANPQQALYAWGSIEPYSWTSLDGQQLDGLLVKPEGFDPSRKYPMIVNFYEKSSDELHRHRAPEPHRSTINYSFYASRGYLIFNPDIPYREGYPGESAYNAVIPGVSRLIDEGFVDPARIGVQGHSWGGYQIAYLLTRTRLFACAEAGAPVVNMVSAYGGIRWASGLSRMFQYERTQSRIGGSLWEYPLRYLENSPIFTVDKITTPVLILHNDEDGAVPWYQGIEFFTALRRLDKPAWMLNYNGEPHWPLKWHNRRDFNIRLQQFFDHYLQDAPLPVWMKSGVPPWEKGIRDGLEMAEEP